MAPVKRPVAVVVWDDARGSATSTFTEKDIPHEPLVMTTMGWLLRDDEKGISVAMEKYSEDGETCWRGHSFIPREMIRSCTLFAMSKVRVKAVPNLEKGMGPKRGEPKSPHESKTLLPPLSDPPA
jgi:hypothetical protein